MGIEFDCRTKVANILQTRRNLESPGFKICLKFKHTSHRVLCIEFYETLQIPDFREDYVALAIVVTHNRFHGGNSLCPTGHLFQQFHGSRTVEYVHGCVGDYPMIHCSNVQARARRKEHSANMCTRRRSRSLTAFHRTFDVLRKFCA